VQTSAQAGPIGVHAGALVAVERVEPLDDAKVQFRVATIPSISFVLADAAVARGEDDRVQLEAGVDLLQLLGTATLHDFRAEHPVVVPAGAKLYILVFTASRNPDAAALNGH
jgi:hypothetical protein